MQKLKNHHHILLLFN